MITAPGVALSMAVCRVDREVTVVWAMMVKVPDSSRTSNVTFFMMDVDRDNVAK